MSTNGTAMASILKVGQRDESSEVEVDLYSVSSPTHP